MTRENATKICRQELAKHGLSDWHIRLTQATNVLGLCSYKDKTIILSTFHLDTHPDPEIVNTIRHEIAHALCPGHGHNDVWKFKAIEVGCTNTAPCSHLSFSPEIIDAIRSGATIEVTFETEIIHRPKYQITRLQDKCEVCGKVAKTKNEVMELGKTDTAPDKKYIFLECGHLIVKTIPKGTPFHTLVSNGWEPHIQTCKHEWDVEFKNKCTKCGEFKLYPFQVEGARFTEAALSVNKGDGIFDEMGLGKTVQSLAYLKFHPENSPVLFIVKSGLKFQWFKEILRWIGPEFLAQIINTSNDFLIPGLKAYIISYDMLVSKERVSKNGKTIKQGFDGARFKELGIKTVVIDECQLIKNPDASRTQEVRKICKETKVIALSGTPWKNRGSEFFTVLNMLDPQKFWSYDKFIERWVDTYWDGKYNRQGGIRNPKAFREFVKDIVIRREVDEVMPELPKTNPMMLYCELNSFEQKEYDNEVSEFVRWYQDPDREEGLEGGNILAKLARMRHITGLAKIPATVEFVTEFIEQTEKKFTVFVHHKDVGVILTDELRKALPNTPILQYTADLSAQARFELGEKFNSLKQCVLVASTQSGGEGNNWQTCGDAMLHERQWNPQNEEQAAPGRFRRIGTVHKLVNVTYMTAAGTVDEILANIVNRKRVDFHNSMNKGQMTTWNQASFTKELAEGIVEAYIKKTKTGSLAKEKK
jgi:hypothetical protein